MKPKVKPKPNKKWPARTSRALRTQQKREARARRLAKGPN
jgi:hypothetical protein